MLYVGQVPRIQPPRQLIGDQIHDALARVGVTEQRVATWLGSCFGCARRRAAANRLQLWAEEALGQPAHVAFDLLGKLLGS